MRPSASLHRLVTRPARLKAEKAGELRQHIMDFAAENDLPQRAVGEVLVALDRASERTGCAAWEFLLMGAVEFNAVADWLEEHSRRPRLAARLWRKLLLYVRRDTNEIVKTRDELAELLGVRPSEISEVMRDLERVHAIRAERVRVPGVKGPGIVRWYLSEHVATTLPGAARDRAQAEAPKLRLVEPA